MLFRNAFPCWLALTLPAIASCGKTTRVEVTVGSVRLCQSTDTWRMVPYATYPDGRQITLRDEPESTLGKLPWGMDHRVELSVTKYPNSAGIGGTSTRFRRVISSTRPSTAAVVLPVNTNCFAAGGRSFVDGQAFTCSTPDVCAAIDRELARAPKGPWEMEIRLADQPGAPFLVERVHAAGERVCKYFPCTPGGGGNANEPK